MEYNIKVEGVKEALKKFDPKKVMKATRAALKDTVKSGKVEASRAIRETLGFKLRKSDLDRRIIIKASREKGEITVTGRPIILPYFGPKMVKGGIATYTARNIREGRPRFGLAQRRVRRRGTGGVQIEIIKGKKKILLKTFIARGKGGIPMVFRQAEKGKGRKLIGLKVYTEASMFKKIMTVVIERVKIQWIKEWQNQLKQLQTAGSWLDK